MRSIILTMQVLLLAVSLLLTGGAQAQSLMPSISSPTSVAPELPDPLTPEAANALISRLSDTQVRQLLLDQINTQTVDGEDTDTGLADFLYHLTTGAFEGIATAVERLPMALSGQITAFSNFGNFVGPIGLLKLFSFLALAVAGGLVAEFAFRRATQKWLVLPEVVDENRSLRQTLSLLFARLSGEILAVGVFVIVTALIANNVVPPYYRPFITLVGPYLIGLPRMSIAIARFLMAPDNPAYRFVYTDDKTAKAIVFHTFWFAFLIGFIFVITPFNAFNRVPVTETKLVFWLNLAVHLYAAIVIWRYRKGLVTMMRGADPAVSPIEDRIARAFPYFGVAVALGTWWLVNIVASYGNSALLSSAPHYKTMALLLFAPAMDTTIRGLVRHLALPMTGEGPVAERAYISAKRSFIRIGRVVVFGIVLILIAGFWDMTLGSIANAGVGSQLAGNVVEFLVILSIGYVIYEGVSLWINRKLAQEQTAAGIDLEDEGLGEGGGAGGSRLSTVLPLILRVSQSIIVVVFVLLGLGNIGVDTTPLLAGAGIVGLAIGFGAQKLVTDVVSGIFFLVDDAFRAGEYVDVNGTMGTVEKISIRSMQLRHHKGPVHTLPYGEIPKITNFSRDWVIMKLRFTVPFGTDPEKVRKIFKKIGQEMMEVEPFKDDFLQPFKSQGVFAFDDVGIVMRGKFMAKPGTQFTIRKEIYNRVNKAFEENGIEFARREVRVAIPGMEESHKLTDDDKLAVAAAATQVAQNTVDAGPVVDKPGE